jgi:hypothetical protein
MRRLFAIVFVLAANGVPAAEAPPEIAAELRRLTQEHLDAIAPGNVDVWRKNLHADVVHVDENGTVRGKDELLKELQPLPAGLVGSLRVDKFQATLVGDTAVATHEDLEKLDYHGQKIVSRWRTTETWLRGADGWKMIGSQTLALLDDPPPAAARANGSCEYRGFYELTPEIRTELRCALDGDLRSMRPGRPDQTYRAEVADVYFQPGQPRTRRIFERDAQGRVVSFVDRREGHDIRWKKLPD